MSDEYDFSVNITLQEVQDLLAIMKETSTSVVGLHWKRENVVDQLYVSAAGHGWADIDQHTDITNYGAV